MQRPILGLVEDSDEDFALFSRVLSANWELTRWSTGERAVDSIAAYSRMEDLAILLVDHDLPGINGIAVIEQVRATPDGHLPLVCMVSGTGRPGIPDAALAAGADAFIAKPDDAQGLRQLPVQLAALMASR